MKYDVEISVIDTVCYTVETASCEEHAREIAEQMFRQDHPDLDFIVSSSSESK